MNSINAKAKSWIVFIEMYWNRLDDTQRLSYLMDVMEGRDPPKTEDVDEIDPDERQRLIKHMGKTIRSYRIKKDFALKDLAKALHKSESIMSQVEAGKKALPAVDLFKASDILSIPPDILFMVKAL